MIIDNFTIISCLSLIILAVLSIVASPFARNIKVKEENNSEGNDEANALPPLTVVVLAHNNPEALDEHLPLILTQDYKSGYEVIVVSEKGDMDTEAVLGKFSGNPLLYTTCIPKRSLFMSKSKLAAALGIKAAHNEWIVMVNGSCRPSSDTWLTSIARNINNSKNLVIGYCNYAEDAPAYYRFVRLRESCYYLRKAIKSTAYRATGPNIAFRRSEFIENDGYRGNLQHVHGEYDFVVNKFASPHSAAVALQPDTFVRDSNYTKKAWNERCIANSHVGMHLQRSKVMRISYITEAILMHTAYIANIAAGIYGALTFRYVTLAIAALCLIATIGFRTWLAKKKCTLFGEEISAWAIPFYELSLVWHDAKTRIRYIKADKHDFSTHKI